MRARERSSGTGGRRSAPRRGSAGVLHRTGDSLLRAFEALFPPPCVACGASVEPGRPAVCRLCWHRLPRMAPPRCARCGATRPVPLPASGGCPECASWDDGAPAVRSPFRMEAGAASLVHALKFRGCWSLAPVMAGAMADGALELAADEEPALVPVPLSAARRRERGYNQAARLASGLAERTGWAVSRALRRRPGGRRQARLGRRERAENVRGRFVAADPARVSRSVLLVDDVVTTGTTATACASALQGAGVAVLGVVSFARRLHAVEIR